MKDIKIHLRNHALFYFLTLSVFAVVCASYVRFIINNDYLVEYEGVCDPTIEHCFVGFDDGGIYYYTIVTKYAPDLYKECGNNITDCEAANICFPTDSKCFITYCDTDVDGNVCSKLNREDSYVDIIYNTNI